MKQPQLEQVVSEELEVEEAAEDPASFRYRIVLREYTERPGPPAPAADFGQELNADLDLSAALGLGALDVPGLAGNIPQIGDLLAPLQPAAGNLKGKLEGAAALLDPLKKLLAGGGG